MQSFKKIYIVVMKLNRFFALHFFANDLFRNFLMGTYDVHGCLASFNFKKKWMQISRNIANHSVGL